jgi:hypothetical protein
VPTRYTATLKLVVPQMVECAHCGCRFVYEKTVSASGCAETSILSGDEAAKAAAAQSARDHLDCQLRNRDGFFDAIPCPECYRYQPYMFKTLGQQKYDTLGCLGYLLLVPGFLAAVAGVILWFALPKDRTTAVGVGVGGATAWGVGYVLLRWVGRLVGRYDPNTENRRARQDKAAERAMSLEEFDDRQAGRARKAIDEHTPPEQPTRRWGKGKTHTGPEPVVEWWVLPAVFIEGGTVTVRLGSAERATVEVPEDAEPGGVFEPTTQSESLPEFKVRLLALDVHQDAVPLE